MTEVDIDVDLPFLMVSGELNIDVLSELQTEEKESLIAKLHQSSSSSSSYHDKECEVGEKKNKKKKNKSLKDNIKVYQNAPKFEPTSGDVSSEDKLVHVAVPEEHTFPLPLPVVATHNEEGEPKECN